MAAFSVKDVHTLIQVARVLLMGTDNPDPEFCDEATWIRKRWEALDYLVGAETILEDWFDQGGE